MKIRHVFLILFFLSIFWLTRSHLNDSLGEMVFRALGASPWSEGVQGLHIPNIIGLILLMISFIGVVKTYRPRYPKIMSRLFIGVIVFFSVTPWVTEHGLSLIHYNARDIGSVQVVPKDRKAFLERNAAGKVTIRDQQFTIYNYGLATRVKIVPIAHGPEQRETIFDSFEVHLAPHSRLMINKTFQGRDTQEDDDQHVSLLDIQVIAVE